MVSLFGSREGGTVLAGFKSAWKPGALVAAGLLLGSGAPTPLRLLGLPPQAIHAVEAAQPELVELGHKAFYDKSLSGDGQVACVTCHDPAKAFSEGRPLAIGISGRHGTRNAPSLLNAAFSAPFFWDGRRATLEAQVLDPLTNGNEHGLSTEALAQKAEAAGYGSPAHLREALAAYVGSLAAGDSPFDRYQYGGDPGALDPAQRSGLLLFQGRAHCADCHTLGPEGASFTDGQFHAIQIEVPGVAGRLAEITSGLVGLSPERLDQLISDDPQVAALGRFAVTLDPKDISRFKTPSLRNVAVTAPYFHDGSAATLAEALDREIYYRSVGAPPVLNPADRADLVAFLGALTSSAANTENSSQGGGR